ncbi:MAG: YdeI/OmpD-associated family protein [Planctomycetota bacterium]|nr:YdeI/OmpD-associated family protein [Planctomycetota bacterium]
MPAKIASRNPPEKERVAVESRAAWRVWLHRHHDQAGGVWVVTYKKGSGGPHVPYAEIVEEALCFGWIDSRPAKLDARRSMLLVSPRSPRSRWSAANKARIEVLTRAGLMTPRGLEVVAAAKRSGTWSALDAVDALSIPADLARSLRSNPEAARNFDAFPRSAKRGILEWILAAKKPETRARRVQETARLAGRNERANAWRPKSPDTAARPVRARRTAR